VRASQEQLGVVGVVNSFQALSDQQHQAIDCRSRSCISCPLSRGCWLQKRVVRMSCYKQSIGFSPVLILLLLWSVTDNCAGETKKSVCLVVHSPLNAYSTRSAEKVQSLLGFADEIVGKHTMSLGGECLPQAKSAA